MGKCLSIKEKAKSVNSKTKETEKNTLENNIIITNAETPITITKKQELRNGKVRIEDKEIIKSNLIISNKINDKILKSVGQINGNEIKLSNNKNCTIIIMDNSSSVIIEKCINCFIFIGPCSSLISLNDCEKINLLSISHDLNIINVHEGNFFIFSITNPKIDNSKNISFGMFCMHFVELIDLLNKSKINIWENHWSQLNYLSTNHENVFFADEAIKYNFIENFQKKLKDCCYVNFEEYQCYPFTYGKNINLNDINNILMIFKSEDLSENEILNFLSPEELSEYETKCICTKIIENYSNKFNDLHSLFQNANNIELSDYITKRNIDQKLNTNNVFDFAATNNNLLNELDIIKNDTDSNKNYNLKNGELLLIWLGSYNNDISSLNDYISDNFDDGHFALVISEYIKLDQGEFCYKLKKLFEFE